MFFCLFLKTPLSALDGSHFGAFNLYYLPPDDSFYILHHMQNAQEGSHRPSKDKTSDDTDVKSWILQYAENSPDPEEEIDPDDESADPVCLNIFFRNASFMSIHNLRVV